MCFLQAFAQSPKGSLVISWSPNSENDLAGYRLYYGFQSRNYVYSKDVGTRTEWTLNNLDPQKKYFVALTAYDIAGNESGFSTEVSAFPDTVESAESSVPHVIILYQNYPNPFNPLTTISYELTKDEHITLRVLNPTGQTIKILFQGEQKAGFHKIEWDGRNEFDRDIASGVYFIRLETAFFQLTKTMIIFR